MALGIHNTLLSGIRQLTTSSLSLILLISLWYLQALAETENVCGRVEILESPGLDFTQSELALMCSDPSREAWKNVTESQTLFHLKTFLELRGYHQIKTDRQGDKTIIQLGPPSVVKTFKLLHAPPELHPERLRRIVGERLTPALLDRTAERLLQQMQAEGFACPKQELRADPILGDLRASLNQGRMGSVLSVTSEPVQDFDVTTLRRFDAFRLDEPFNGDWLRVTENRVINDGVLQNTHFSVVCLEQGVALIQKNIIGPPRSLNFGVGFNTERGPSARASWKHVRLGLRGSSLEFALSGSFRLQEFVIKPKWYFLSSASRLYFSPLVSFKREDEKLFERYSGTLQLTPATSWDNQTMGLTLTAGPTLNFLRAVRGPNPGDSNFLSFNSSVKLQSHAHELYRTSPREGSEADFTVAVTQQDVFSNVTAQKLNLTFEYLHNVKRFDPPLLVLGFRGSVGTTFVDSTAKPRLPQSFRHFLGGSNDLRGFPRSQLPGVSGALTSAFLSTEARLPDSLPHGIQPLLFTDLGAMGTESASFDPGVFISPGLGVRWESPIGTIRSTAARGFVSNSSNDRRAGWQIYFSYGEEF